LLFVSGSQRWLLIRSQQASSNKITQFIMPPAGQALFLLTFCGA